MLKITLTSIAALTFMLSPASALPGGGDGTSGTTASPPAKNSPKALKCKRDETIKRVKKNGKFRRICVKLKAGILSDDELYQQARALPMPTNMNGHWTTSGSSPRNRTRRFLPIRATRIAKRDGSKPGLAITSRPWR